MKSRSKRSKPKRSRSRGGREPPNIPPPEIRQYFDEMRMNIVETINIIDSNKVTDDIFMKLYKLISILLDNMSSYTNQYTNLYPNLYWSMSSILNALTNMVKKKYEDRYYNIIIDLNK